MENQLATLSLQFATSVILMCDDIRNRAHIKNQILRAACSIGANIHEAQYGCSKNDFLFKLQIALKECNETRYWLELLKNTETISVVQAHELEQKCNRIRFMLIKSINTTKSRFNIE
ncbi:MAG: four helix bundle protein [Akkermansia sp.]|nr:four helix bundle protein [Akkermansia sp.]